MFNIDFRILLLFFVKRFDLDKFNVCHLCWDAVVVQREQVLKYTLLSFTLIYPVVVIVVVRALQAKNTHMFVKDDIKNYFPELTDLPSKWDTDRL